MGKILFGVSDFPTPMGMTLFGVSGVPTPWARFRSEILASPWQNLILSSDGKSPGQVQRCSPAFPIIIGMFQLVKTS
jgi:hypothetical protein